MVATVKRIGVFEIASLTQGESGHAGVGTIIGQRLNQGVARPALRAVDKWVAIAAVLRVIQFLQTIITGEQVGRQVDVSIATRQAWQYLEFITFEAAG